MGCSPWGHKESDTTERFHLHFSLSCTGAGHGNPPQCSCLEDPRDGSRVGCRLWGHTESDTTDMTAAAVEMLNNFTKSIHPVVFDTGKNLTYQPYSLSLLVYFHNVRVDDNCCYCINSDTFL